MGRALPTDHEPLSRLTPDLVQAVVAFFGADVETFVALLATCRVLHARARQEIPRVFEAALLQFPAFALRRPFLPADYNFLRGYLTHRRLAEGDPPAAERTPRGTFDDFLFAVEFKLSDEDTPRSVAAEVDRATGAISTGRIDGDFMERDDPDWDLRQDFETEWVRLYAIQRASGRIGLLCKFDDPYRDPNFINVRQTNLIMDHANLLRKNKGELAWTDKDDVDDVDWNIKVKCQVTVHLEPERGATFDFTPKRFYGTGWEEPSEHSYRYTSLPSKAFLVMLERDIDYSLY